MASIRQIAKAAKTSSATVSRVLNNDASFSVSPETAAKVRQVAADLGYIKPQQNSRGLQIITTQSQAMELNDPYFRKLRLAIEDQARKQAMKIAPTLRFDGSQRDISLTSLADFGGLIVIGGFSAAAIQAFREVNANLVVIDDPYVSADVDGVYCDMRAYTAQLLTRWYAQHNGPIAYIGGHRNVYGLNGEIVTDDQELRYLGYCDAAKNNAEPIIASLDGWSPASGEQQAAWYLKLDPRPQAVMLGADPLAIGFIRGLAAAGLALADYPEMVSFDDSEMAEFTTPSLSTVQLPVAWFGKNAVRLLAERDEGRENAVHMIIQPRLILRESLPILK